LDPVELSANSLEANDILVVGQANAFSVGSASIGGCNGSSNRGGNGSSNGSSNRSSNRSSSSAGDGANTVDASEVGSNTKAVKSVHTLTVEATSSASSIIVRITTVV